MHDGVFYKVRNHLLILLRIPLRDALFSPDAFKILFVFHFTVSLWCVWVWLSLNFFYLELSFWDAPLIFLRANLRWFWPSFLQIFFFPVVSLLFRGLLLCVCWSTWWQPTGLRGSVSFSFILSLRLDNLNWPIFKFVNYLCHQFTSVARPLFWIF